MARSLRAEDTALAPLTHGDLQGAAKGIATPSQVCRTFYSAAEYAGEKLRSNDEVSRGSTAVVYAKTAPAVVLIAAGNSFGTGVLIDEDGWILTNQHVVASAPFFIKTGVQVVKVFLGHMSDQMMVLDEPSILAMVYKSSERQDLALLKLTQMPANMKKLPVIPLAESTAAPGSECIVLGHPRAGLLWTVRRGEVAGVGRWPQDMMHAVTAKLASSEKGRESLTKAFAAEPVRKVLVSSCGVNPGDSGGPLLNAEGELIGLTFGRPKSDSEKNVSPFPFGYHVHLDEIKQFIKDRPNEPTPLIPSPWPPALASRMMDRDKNKIPETLVFYLKADEAPTGYLCDLNEDSSADFDPAKLSDPEMQKLWHFQFCYQRLPLHRTFYDTKNSGQIDVILTDFNGDGIAEAFLKLENGGWKAVPPGGQKMFDSALFQDKKLAERFGKIHRSVAVASAAKKPANAPSPKAPPSP